MWMAFLPKIIPFVYVLTLVVHNYFYIPLAECGGELRNMENLIVLIANILYKQVQNHYLTILSSNVLLVVH